MTNRIRMLAGLVVLALACSGVPGVDAAVAQVLSLVPRLTVSPAGAPAASQPGATSGAVYYVGASGCDDAGAGDAQTPFCTFEQATSRLLPGDTLIITADTYTDRLVLSEITGTVGAPIVVRGEGRDTVVFDGGCSTFPCAVEDVSWPWDEEAGMVNIVDSGYVMLQDVTVQNVIAAGVSVLRGRGIVVDNVRIDGTGNAGMLLKYLSDLSDPQRCRARPDGLPRGGRYSHRRARGAVGRGRLPFRGGKQPRARHAQGRHRRQGEFERWRPAQQLGGMELLGRDLCQRSG